MCPRLIHLYGPVWVASYGVMIAIGFLVFLLCTLYHPIRRRFIDETIYQNALFIGLFSGIIGGRVGAVLTDWSAFSDNWIEIFYPWVGGFMVLGSIIGVLLIAPWYLRMHKVPILPILDLASLYAPLMQSIARFGCFFSGCCYGLPLDNVTWYAVRFTDPAGSAPLGVWLHPAQLYVSLASFIIFLLIQAVYRTVTVKRGQLVFLYLTLESASRFIVDFWRGDRGDLVFVSGCGKYGVSLSQPQVWNGIFFFIALALFIIVSCMQKRADYRDDIA